MSEPATATSVQRREPVRTFRVDAYTITLLPRAPYEADYVAATGIAGFAFDAQQGDHAFASDRRRPFRARPNTLSWVPAGCDVWSRSSTGGEYLTITSTARQGAVGGAGGNGAWPPWRWSDRPHAHAARAALALRAGLLRGDLDDGAARLCIESMERATHAACAASDAGSVRDARWLTDARLRRIEAYLDAHVADPVAVADLAAACGISPGFLTRICRAATGLTPHAWLLDRRLVRARSLLTGTGASVADVALACGFASHAHLTATMRRRLGVVPSRLRRDIDPAHHRATPCLPTTLP